jgi:K+-transporting ATPase KdpF subunit
MGNYPPPATASAALDAFRKWRVLPLIDCGLSPLQRISMVIDYLLGGVVTAALLVYLGYVLLRPERL